jgi:hypothetical protein
LSPCGIRCALRNFTNEYNTYRPHGSINNLTPEEYLNMPEEQRPAHKVYKKRDKKSEIQAK